MSNIKDKERPLLFSGEMVRALLAERKTQTRRVVQPQPVLPVRYAGVCLDGSDTHYWERLDEAGNGTEDYTPFPCPYGKPGDRLWVRETFFCNSFDYPEATQHARENLLYRADGQNGLDGESVEAEGGGWKPSIHMPRWASRLTLEVVSIHVERVQNITDADAIAEGVIRQQTSPPFDGLPWCSIPGDERDYRSPREAYHYLWDSINAKRGFEWGANPWVWVVEFTLRKGSMAE